MGNTTSAATGLFKDSRVAFQTSDGVAGEGTILRLNRFAVSFENTNSAVAVRLSEVLQAFTVKVGGREIYVGRATVKNLMATGASATACEVTLEEESWREAALFPEGGSFISQLNTEYNAFINGWEALSKLSPSYKLVLSDMQTYFSELRMWLDHLEAGLKSASPDIWAEREQKILQELSPKVNAMVDQLWDRFEVEARAVDSDWQAAHEQLMRHQLHALVLAAPFAWRTYHKPLGYAGDYEMVNMILRKAPEGKTLFAKLLNLVFVNQAPAEAHRNRIKYLVRKITEETVRCSSLGRNATVMSLACGPANEVERFVGESHIADKALFTLLDFNEETLQYTQSMITRAATKNRFVKYNKPIRCVRKNIPQLVKESLRGGSVVENQYDFLYCAGLFDYLSDQVCHQIMETMYRWLAPGGLMVTTNVDPANPVRVGMAHLLDWHLIYRTGPELMELGPTEAHPDDTRVLADETGVNVFLEVRKPE